MLRRPTASDQLRPASMPPSSMVARPNSANFLLTSPSDIAGPSPATSTGTETTEIEDEASEEYAAHQSTAGTQVNPKVLRRFFKKSVLIFSFFHVQTYG